MHILMFGMSSYPGGIENYIANYFLTDELPSGVTVDFVTYENEIAYADRIRSCGHAVHVVPHLKKDPLGYMRALRSLFRRTAYDCVYVNMLSAANILPLRCAVKYRVPRIVAHAHANSTVKGFLRKFLHRINKRYCQRHAKYKFACSKEAGKWLFGNRPSVIIPNAIDASRFAFDRESRNEIRGRHGIPDGAFVIGHVGRFAEEKNHGFLLDVFSACATALPGARLLLVGDGALRPEIEDKAERLGLSDKVILAGTSGETEKYYSAFDCFVFPSVFEGFGMAALEAEAAGLPCFCSDSLSPELRVADSLVFLPLQRGAEHWARAILRADCGGDRAAREFPEEFNIKAQRKKMLEILQ